MPEMETLKLKFVLQLGGFMFVFHSKMWVIAMKSSRRPSEQHVYCIHVIQH